MKRLLLKVESTPVDNYTTFRFPEVGSEIKCHYPSAVTHRKSIQGIVTNVWPRRLNKGPYDVLIRYMDLSHEAKVFTNKHLENGGHWEYL